MSAEDFSALIAGLLTLGILAIAFALVLRGLSTGLSNRLLRAAFVYLIVVGAGSAGSVSVWHGLGPDGAGMLAPLVLGVAAVVALGLAVRALFAGAGSRQCSYCDGHGYVLVAGMLGRKKRDCEHCHGTGRC